MNFIKHHSPSSLNLFCASPAMWVLEKVVGVRQSVGSPAHRGTAVEEGVTLGLLNPDAPMQACVDAALKKYDTVSALSGDARRQDTSARLGGGRVSTESKGETAILKLPAVLGWHQAGTHLVGSLALRAGLLPPIMGRVRRRQGGAAAFARDPGRALGRDNAASRLRPPSCGRRGSYRPGTRAS